MYSNRDMPSPASIPVLGKAIELLQRVAEDDGTTSQAQLARSN